jgi:hypothetical protein
MSMSANKVVLYAGFSSGFSVAISYIISNIVMDFGQKSTFSKVLVLFMAEMIANIITFYTLSSVCKEEETSKE